MLSFIWQAIHCFRANSSTTAATWCLQVAINLADSYEKAFEHTRRQLMTQPKGKQFDFNKDKIFEKFNIFKRRLEKLVDMFKTIHQFSSLEQHTHIEGLSDMIANFNTITDNVRMKVRMPAS